MTDLPSDSLPYEERRVGDRPARGKDEKSTMVHRTTLVHQDEHGDPLRFHPPDFVALEPLATGQLAVAHSAQSISVGDDFTSKAGTFRGEVPPEVDNYLIILPDEVGERIDPEELVKEIMTFSRKWVDIPNQDRIICSLYIMLTWLFEGFPIVPYLRFLGDTGTGKTRALDVFGDLCFKTVKTGGGSTVPALLRLIDKYQGSLVIDEADFKSSDEKSDIAKLLNVRHTQGANITRCNPVRRADVDIWPVFGPTVLATRLGFDDQALEARCYTIVMQQTERNIPRNLNLDFTLESQRLRNALLRFRLERMHTWDPPLLTDEDEAVLMGLEPRLAQIAEPLLRLDVGSVREVMRDILVAHQRDLIATRAGSDLGLVVHALHSLWAGSADKVSATEVRDTVEAASGTTIDPKVIGRHLSSTRLPKYRTKRGRGYELRSPEARDALRSLFKRYVPDYDEDEAPREVQATIGGGGGQ